MQTTTEKTITNTRRNCLGCAECKGLCLDLFDLVFLPETVLHRSTNAP